MGFFDRFLDAIRLNDDYDDDEFYDDEEEDFDDDYDEYEEEKPKKRFFDKFTKKSDVNDYDDDDFDDEGFDFGDEDSIIYEVKCACGEIINFDEETLEEGSIVCDSCGELLEFSLEEEGEE